LHRFAEDVDALGRVAVGDDGALGGVGLDGVDGHLARDDGKCATVHSPGFIIPDCARKLLCPSFFGPGGLSTGFSSPSSASSSAMVSRPFPAAAGDDGNDAV